MRQLGFGLLAWFVLFTAACEKDDLDKNCDLRKVDVSSVTGHMETSFELDSFLRPSKTISISGDTVTFGYTDNLVWATRDKNGDTTLVAKLNAEGLPIEMKFQNPIDTQVYKVGYQANGELAYMEAWLYSVGQTPDIKDVLNKVQYDQGNIVSYEVVSIYIATGDTSPFRQFHTCHYNFERPNTAFEGDKIVGGVGYWHQYLGGAFDGFNPDPFNQNQILENIATNYNRYEERFTYKYNQYGELEEVKSTFGQTIEYKYACY